MQTRRGFAPRSDSGTEMPVHRYRDVRDMPDRTVVDRDDPNLWASIARIWESGRRLSPPRFPAGVYKHRTIEEMNRQTEEWARRNAASRRDRG